MADGGGSGGGKRESVVGWLLEMQIDVDGVRGRQTIGSCEGREGIYNDGDQALIECLLGIVHQKLGSRCWGLPTKI